MLGVLKSDDKESKQSDKKQLQLDMTDFDTSRKLYRGSTENESDLKQSSGWDHGVLGISTSPDKGYAATHGDNVKEYYGRKGEIVDFFDLVNEYEYETGNDFSDVSEEDLTKFAQSKGYVASRFNDPQAGEDIRYFDPKDLIQVEGNNGDFSKDNNDIRYSKSQTTGDTGRTRTPEQLAALSYSDGIGVTNE